MFRLKDRVALVTGASQGIGRATAIVLAGAGAKVACAARNAEKLSSVVKEIAAAGGEAIAIQMDVTKGDQVKAGFKSALDKFGKLDILVNNAGVTRDTLALRMKPEDWDAVIRTNLTGAHLCIQQALGAMMRARYGRIINVTSVGADGESRASELCVCKGRIDRADKGHRAGVCLAKYNRKRCGAGVHCDADDGSAAAAGEGRDAGAGSARTNGHGRGNRGGDCFSGER